MQVQIKLIDALQDFRQTKIENKRLKAENNKLVEGNKVLTMENDDLLKRLQNEDYYRTAIAVVSKENQHLRSRSKHFNRVYKALLYSMKITIVMVCSRNMASLTKF